MIQRVQSLFLLIAATIHISLFFLTLYSVSSVSPGYESAMSVYLISHSVPDGSTQQLLYLPMILNLLLSGLIIFIILIFRNRPLQAYLTRLSILLWTGLVVALFVSMDKVRLPEGVTANTPVYHPTVFILGLSFVMLFLARRAIQKDEMMVRSADRIR